MVQISIQKPAFRLKSGHAPACRGGYCLTKFKILYVARGKDAFNRSCGRVGFGDYVADLISFELPVEKN
ncbi:MAG: hypothetical protein JW863_13115 [Chitinispirillaceae bacterium]|nr:hypothetical protein [Chitinispirillaceae bacterium]